MKKRNLKKLYSFLGYLPRIIILLGILLYLFTTSLSAQCDHPDYDGLMEFYNSTNGDNWHKNEGWEDGANGTSCDPCQDNWHGIICEEGRVSILSLFFNNLSGELSDLNLSEISVLQLNANNLTGAIPNFSHVPEMSSLNLVENDLSGEIPDFSHMPNLTFLFLDNNNLSGSIVNFQSIPYLKQFTCENNNLTGPIPPFNKCIEITDLKLNNNNFNDTIPNFTALPNLNHFAINNAEVIGTLPSFSKNLELESLSFYSNNIEGKIPDFSSHLDLRHVNAAQNNLEGCFPENCFFFDFQSSFLGNTALAYYGNYSEFCEEGRENIGAHCHPKGFPGATTTIDENCCCTVDSCGMHPDYNALKEIFESTGGENWTNNIGWNALFEGWRCSPCNEERGNIYGVSCENDRVTCIDLDGSVTCDFNGTGGNNLVGEWPAVQLDFLELLIIDDNQLTGNLPDLSLLPRLKDLRASNNLFTGNLPELNHSSNLEALRVSFNNLTGAIPDYSTNDALNFLTIANNNLSGCYDTWMCNLELFHATGNTQLAWYGNVDPYCMGTEQLLAPCGDSLQNFIIQEDCACLINPTSIEELHNNISIFPNPSKDFIYISNTEAITSFNLHDISGRMHRHNSPTQNQIDISDLRTGLYILTLVFKDGKTASHKIAKL